MKRGRRYDQIDVMYTIGTVLVAMGHSHSSDWTTFSGTVLEKMILFIYLFHMPLFFFIAGFLFMNSSSFTEVKLEKWIWGKTVKLLTPYIILSVIAAMPKYYFENGACDGMITYLVTTVFVPRLSVWGHLWFLPVLLSIYLIFGIWRKYIFEKNAKIAVLIVLIISLFLYFSSVFDTRWLGITDIKSFCIYFVLGCIFKLMKISDRCNTKKYQRAILIILGIGISVLLTEFGYVNQMAGFVIAIMMIGVCWQIACVVGSESITTWISRHNFTIYIYSWPFQAMAMLVCSKMGWGWLITAIVMFVVGIAVPVIMCIIYDNWRQIQNSFFDLLLGRK